MKKMKKFKVLITIAKLRKLIKSGRSAIELRILDVLIRPSLMNDADQAEMEQLTALLITYNELMAAYEKPKSNKRVK
jgi:hypothetical protein